MSNVGLPFPTSNNAPLPVPGGYGNPTGANFGAFGSSTGQPFPTMPAYGWSGGGGGGPSFNVGSFGTGTGLAGLNAGIVPGYSGPGKDLYNMLGKAYGKGTGAILGDLLSGGLFNPQVVAAFLNAQQPGIARGEAGIEGAFADAGARFSSAAGIGMGDYESQVQLNQQQVLAQMFQNAQLEEVGLLQNLLPTIQKERANSSGWANKLAGAMDIFSSMIGTDPKSAGPSLMAGIGKLGGGASADANASELSMSGGPAWDTLSKFGNFMTGGGSGMFNSMGNNSSAPNLPATMQQSGGSAIGGGGMDINSLMQMFMQGGAGGIGG
jgi:hypothetical protein